MILDKKKKRDLHNEIIKNINSLRERFGEEKSFVDRIIGVNYALATVSLMNEMGGDLIFDDNYIDEDKEEIGFSKKYLSKRFFKFYKLLNNFMNTNYRGEENALLLGRENELEENINILELNEGINWLQRNGYYGTFKMIREGYITYGEWGESVERMLQKRNLKKNQSTVNKLES